MKFLKDMIAKKMSAIELDERAEEEWDDQDYADWEHVEDDDAVAEELLDEAPDPEEETEAVAFEPSEDALDDPDLSEMPEEDAEEPDQDDTTMKIWEMFNEEEDEAERDTPAAEAPVDADPDPESSSDLAREALKTMIGPPPVLEKVAIPSALTAKKAAAAQDAQPAERAGRVKTRMLGFHTPDNTAQQVFDRAKTRDAKDNGRFPVGWLVVIEGPGRGTPFALHYGVSNIGRAADQTVSLRFGDNSISRESHAVLAYDEDSNTFYIGHTGKANLVRLNGRPVLSTEEIANFDLIRIGETTLRFVGFCGPEFAWDMTDDEEDVVHAQAS